MFKSVSIRSGERNKAELTIKEFFGKFQAPVIGMLAYLDETTFRYLEEIPKFLPIKILTSAIRPNKIRIQEAARLQVMERPALAIVELIYLDEKGVPKPLLHERWLSDGNVFVDIGIDLKSATLGSKQHTIQLDDAKKHEEQLKDFKWYWETAESKLGRSLNKRICKEYIYPERSIEEIKEEEICNLFLAYPSLIEDGLKFQSIKGPTSKLQIDLLFKDKNEVDTFVEVDYETLHLDQMIKYARAMENELKAKKCRLIWCIPKEKSVGITLENTEIRVYDKKLVEDWIILRKNAAARLEDIHRTLTKQFEYEVGKKILPSYRISFKNVIDALYFYGYLTRDSGASKPKKIKVGFHLATLGWNFDLVRSLASKECFFNKKYPELLVKLIFEVLSAPIWYDDPKISRGIVICEQGFAHFVKNYKKKGSNIDRVRDLCDEIHRTASNVVNYPMKEVKEAIERLNPADYLKRFDLMEMISEELVKSVSEAEFIPALSLLHKIVEEFNLTQTELTPKIHLPNGEKVVNARTGKKGTYLPYMARRILELMSLKGIIIPQPTMYPAFKMLVKDRDQLGRKRYIVEPASDFRYVGDSKIHEEIIKW